MTRNEHHLLAESALTGPTTAYEYIWLGNFLVGEKSASTNYYISSDHLGTPTILTNSAGSIAWQADYEPFGAIYDLRTADLHQPIRRRGQEAEEFDDGAGPNGDSPRFYNHARWYIPKWGAYTQSDPMGAMGSPFGKYAYAYNDPYSRTDESGECLVQAFYDKAHIDASQFHLSNHQGIPGWHESIVLTPTDDRGQVVDNPVPMYFNAGPTQQVLFNWGNLLVDPKAQPFVQSESWWNYEKYSQGTAPTIIADTTNDNSCNCATKSLSALATSIDNANIQYDPISAAAGDEMTYANNGQLYRPTGSSNTFAYMAAQDLGVQPPPPPSGVSLPGYSDPYPQLL